MAETTVQGVRLPFLPVRGVEALKEPRALEGAREGRFDEILQQEIGRLRFSRHAQERIESRNLNLDQRDITLLEGAVDRAEQKGAQDSLVFLRDMAFIVSVKNRTVVTALDGENLRDNVFTKIDSAVIAE
jgi:flagellar operon protein